MLRKNPGFTFVAVLTLALGISANATIFSFVSAVLYSRPPVSDSERVLVVYGTSMTKLWGPNLNPVSAPNYFIWKKENKVFDDLAATDPYYSSSLTGQGEPERVSTTRATANYFPVLGVTPELGRTFVAGEDQSGHDHVVILNHELWERRFGSDRTLVGKTIRLNGEAYTVIGVMPPRFRLMSFLAQVWIPLVLDESQQSAAARENRNLFLFARLKPGATLEQAQANITTLGTIAAQSFPQTENGWGAYTLALQEYLIRDFNAGPAFIILLSAVGFVLLIACANIAGLLIARAAGRGKEMAVRIAIGAGRLRVVRQLMTEAMLIALLGAAVGLAIALFGQRLLQTAMSFNDAVKLLELKLDWRVLCFTASISVFSALLFGLAPALKAWSVEVFSTLKNDSSTVSSGKKKSRMRNVLVAGEVALAVVLLTATGIMLKGFIEGLNRSLGFEPQHLLTAQITLPDSPYKEPAKQIQFYRDLISRLEAIPGAKSAAVSSVLPATGPENVAFRLQGQENLPAGERARARHFVVSSQYLEATEIALLAGRGFSESDDAKSPAVALVSEKFVERFFPRGDALGKQILIDSGDAAASQWREIVGIVRNVKSWPIQLSDDPEIYEPFQQHPLEEMAVIVRANGDANSLAPGLRKSVWAIDRDQPIGSIISMPEILANETAGERIMGTLMGTFGALALLLAGIGIYGLVAFTVGQRSREIGIRLAMGAEKKSILRLVLRDGMKLALIGLAIGMAGALPLPQAFGSLLQDFRVSGGWLFVIVPALIGGVALLACFIPARRAARVDPMVSLRHE
jgi:putative ABC transport system permease protein